MRSREEADLYIQQRACVCGDIEFVAVGANVLDEGVMCLRIFGNCRTCGRQREFLFEQPPRPLKVTGQIQFGGPDSSRLLDAGEWLAVAEYYAKLDPGTYKDLDTARAAMEEVLKFLPAGVDRMPEEAFWSEKGRAVREREPARFRRARLEAILDAYKKHLAKIDLTKSSLVWTHTGDAEIPYQTTVDGRPYTIRINDFPAESMYTLISNGRELRDIESWPPTWVMPDPPKELLDLVKPKN
jgi:hypothetical protein